MKSLWDYLRVDFTWPPDSRPLFLFLADDRRDGLQLLPSAQIHQLHALRVAAGLADLFHGVRTIWPLAVMSMISSVRGR